MFKSIDKSEVEAAAGSDQKRVPRKRRRWVRAILYLGLGMVGVIVCIRPMLPWAVRWYVNKTLSQSVLYEGRIGDVTLDLWRGAYSIDDVRIFKTNGEVPEPLFKCKRLELAVQWNAVLDGKIVGEVTMQEPEVNFVDSSDDSEGQTGAGGPWLAMLRALFPFDLNRLEMHDGSIHFHSYRRATPVDIYLDQLEGTVDDLTNIRGRTAELLTTIHAKGMAMDQAEFEFNMKLDPFSYNPHFEMAARLIGLDVTTLNALTMTYGRFDFKHGWFDLVVEAQAHAGEIQGYVKPLFRDLTVFDLVEDVKGDKDPLQFFWQALLGVTTGVFKNQQRNQFGTYVPFTGDLSKPKGDILAMVGNVLRNAFIRAYLPRLEDGSNSYDGMEFEPGSITGPDSVGDQP